MADAQLIELTTVFVSKPRFSKLGIFLGNHASGHSVVVRSDVPELHTGDVVYVINGWYTKGPHRTGRYIRRCKHMSITVWRPIVHSPIRV